MVHLWRFGSPVVKFKTALDNPTNKAFVLLEDGLLKVLDLGTMSQ